MNFAKGLYKRTLFVQVRLPQASAYLYLQFISHLLVTALLSAVAAKVTHGVTSAVKGHATAPKKLPAPVQHLRFNR